MQEQRERKIKMVEKYIKKRKTEKIGTVKRFTPQDRCSGYSVALSASCFFAREIVWMFRAL